MDSFEPFRVVGAVCGAVPLSATSLYGTPLLMVATGRTYQLFKGKELAMIRGGPTFQETLRAVAQSGKYRVAAEGPRIHALVHHKPLWTRHHEEVTKPEVIALLAQDDLVFSLGEDKHIVVRDIKTGDVLNTITVEKSESVTAMVLPSSYRNKLLVATEEGSLHLYNYRNGECLWYAAREGSSAAGLAKDKGTRALSSSATSTGQSSTASITALTCSVYKDILAYGTSEGKVVVLNYGTDEVITTFHHEERAAVTSLAFRVDKPSLLLAGTSLGQVIVWDLEHRCLDGILTRSKQVRSEKEAFDFPHVDLVHSLVTFPQQPELASLVVTAGADNALVQFRFDTVDGLGLLVRERRGHMGSCTVARFYNSDLLITAGQDRAVRMTHVFSDRASWELSQGRLGKRGREKQISREAMKFPPVTAIASSTTRNYQWSSVITLHEAAAYACGWRTDTRALDFKLSGVRTSSHTARCVTVSACGNYAVVGYSSGNAVRLQLQNRSMQQFFDPALSQGGGAPAAVATDRAHASAVEGVEVVCGNTVVVTTGLDGAIKFWDLLSVSLLTTVHTALPISSCCAHQDASLLFVAQHTTIRGYNANPHLNLSGEEMRTPVRVLDGHNSPITAMALAPDTNRHLVSASGDGVLLVWDLAAAACVGQYRFASPALSLAFHTDALFLATVHPGEHGAFLWVNNMRYGYVPEVVESPKTVPIADIPFLHYPTAHGAVEETDLERDSTAKTNGGGASAAAEGEESTEAQEAAAAREADLAEAELYDASKDVGLHQQRRLAERWAELDAVKTEGLSLAGVPRSVWFNLTVLDQIKEKNQPLLPPKKKDVPFFLGGAQDALRPAFLLVASDKAKGDTEAPAGPSSSSSAAAGGGRLHEAEFSLTATQRMLVGEEYEAFMAHLLALATAPAMDLEIKCVVEYADGSSYTETEIGVMETCLRGLLKFFTYWLERGEKVDLVQGLIADTIRSHGALITRLGATMVPELTALAEAQSNTRYTVDHLVAYPTCLAGSFSGSFF